MLRMQRELNSKPNSIAYEELRMFCFSDVQE